MNNGMSPVPDAMAQEMAQVDDVLCDNEAEYHIAKRPANHGKAARTINHVRAAGVPVQFGTAVRKNPPSAAVA